MNSVVIDTNPLIYIVQGTPNFGRKYAVLLDELSGKNTLVIPKIVYGELSLAFGTETQLNNFLSDVGIVVSETKKGSYATAANRWMEYNARRAIRCQNCGTILKKVTCCRCRHEIKIKQHILSDFLIGAFALDTDSKTLVTSDKGYFKTYFPELNIVQVSSE